MNYQARQPWRTASRPRLLQSGQSGFTLTEVMVALFILVGGMISATMFFGSMARAARFTDSAIVATGLAQAQLETLLEQTYAGMTNGYDASTVYTRSWSVLHSNTLAYIGVTVHWTDADGHTNTVTLGTVRAP